MKSKCFVNRLSFTRRASCELTTSFNLLSMFSRNTLWWYIVVSDLKKSWLFCSLKVSDRIESWIYSSVSMSCFVSWSILLVSMTRFMNLKQWVVRSRAGLGTSAIGLDMLSISVEASYSSSFIFSFQTFANTSATSPLVSASDRYPTSWAHHSRRMSWTIYGSSPYFTSTFILSMDCFPDLLIWPIAVSRKTIIFSLSVYAFPIFSTNLN